MSLVGLPLRLLKLICLARLQARSHSSRACASHQRREYAWGRRNTSQSHLFGSAVQAALAQLTAAAHQRRIRMGEAQHARSHFHVLHVGADHTPYTRSRDFDIDASLNLRRAAPQVSFTCASRTSRVEPAPAAKRCSAELSALCEQPQVRGRDVRHLRCSSLSASNARRRSPSRSVVRAVARQLRLDHRLTCLNDLRLRAEAAERVPVRERAPPKIVLLRDVGEELICRRRLSLVAALQAHHGEVLRPLKIDALLGRAQLSIDERLAAAAGCWPSPAPIASVGTGGARQELLFGVQRAGVDGFDGLRP